mmetsp:Transcript_110934/g.237039  ORF Transcript_110934/g.237039 Transcript_110934/m.237039 type:complete len:225 (+) Transcript_110934:400-1074(+)
MLAPTSIALGHVAIYIRPFIFIVSIVIMGLIPITARFNEVGLLVVLTVNNSAVVAISATLPRSAEGIITLGCLSSPTCHLAPAQGPFLILAASDGNIRTAIAVYKVRPEGGVVHWIAATGHAIHVQGLGLLVILAGNKSAVAAIVAIPLHESAERVIALGHLKSASRHLAPAPSVPLFFAACDAGRQAITVPLDAAAIRVVSIEMRVVDWIVSIRNTSIALRRM